RELYLRMRYADVSDANLYYGNMRFDVNVSVSKTDELGTRTETKNLNSFKSVEKAVEYEIERQIGLLEKGEKIVQETRGWDDTKQQTFSQRSKEDAHDYRYMPDPDLPPIVLDDAYVDSIKADMPKLPDDYRTAFSELGLTDAVVEDIVATPDVARTVMEAMSAGPEHAKRIAFWLMQPQTEEPDETEGVATAVDVAKLVTLSEMVAANKLSSTAAKDVLAEVLKTGDDPEKIAEAKNLLQVSDEGAIAEIVKQVLADNPKAAGDVQGGEMKAIGFLVGQVMKASKGKANPALSTELIKKQLGI
ncbi:Asp-tRNA(Asn)/Glu-tRNA(Gln) amidotransferase subunit GatB, partial [Candidatus Saccharibacteria bacterium]|nr:Asp-tRNA(Asn)/Glu-tRNA(Gln) amidotransferase subunit GatB [Candidatus Saccharibacteria bacterium]